MVRYGEWELFYSPIILLVLRFSGNLCLALWTLDMLLDSVFFFFFTSVDSTQQLDGAVVVQLLSRVEHYEFMDCGTPCFPVVHCLLELAQTHVHWVGDAIQPSHPLSPPSPPALSLSQHQGLSPKGLELSILLNPGWLCSDKAPIDSALENCFSCGQALLIEQNALV